MFMCLHSPILVTCPPFPTCFLSPQNGFGLSLASETQVVCQAWLLRALSG